MSTSSLKVHPKRTVRASRTNSLYRTGAAQSSMRAAAGTSRKRGCTYGRKPSGQCRSDPEKAKAGAKKRRTNEYKMNRAMPFYQL